jgi:hypothetical protein
MHLRFLVDGVKQAYAPALELRRQIPRSCNLDQGCNSGKEVSYRNDGDPWVNRGCGPVGEHKRSKDKAVHNKEKSHKRQSKWVLNYVHSEVGGIYARVVIKNDIFHPAVYS